MSSQQKNVLTAGDEEEDLSPHKNSNTRIHTHICQPNPDPNINLT